MRVRQSRMALRNAASCNANGASLLFACLLSHTPSPLPPQKKKVNGQPSTKPVVLTSGLTDVSVKVLAADKTTTNTYTVAIYKDRLGKRPTPLDTKAAEAVECPLCLSVLHRPHKTLPEQTSFCTSCLTTLTRTVSRTPLLRKQIASTAPDTAAEKKADGLLVKCLWARFGCAHEASLATAGTHVANCEHGPKLSEVSGQWVAAATLLEHDKAYVAEDNLKALFEGDAPTVAMEHDSAGGKPRKWEKRLSEMEGRAETDAAKVLKEAEKRSATFLKLPKVTDRDSKAVLEAAQACLASWPFKGDAEARALCHLRLGMLVEEQFHLEERQKLEWCDSSLSKDDALLDQGSDINKDDDIKAICKLHGTPAGALISEILIAVDAEYKKLLSEGNSERADYVQGLHAWKSQQTKMDGGGGGGGQGGAAAAGHFPGSKSLIHLGKALDKYKDAAAADPTLATARLHIGRVLLLLGNHKDAYPRLKEAVTLEPGNVQAKFLLGVAGLRANPKSAKLTTLVSDGLQAMFYERVRIKYEDLAQTGLPVFMYSCQMCVRACGRVGVWACAFLRARVYALFSMLTCTIPMLMGFFAKLNRQHHHHHHHQNPKRFSSKLEGSSLEMICFTPRWACRSLTTPRSRHLIWLQKFIWLLATRTLQQRLLSMPPRSYPTSCLITTGVQDFLTNPQSCPHITSGWSLR